MRPVYKKLRSGFEDTIKADLIKKGVDFGYETIKLQYTKSCCPNCGTLFKRGTYTPDFIIQRPNGIPLVVESKGRFTASDRTKMLKVRECNKGQDIRFVFQRDNRIRKGSDTFYSGWCRQHGFLFFVGNFIPEGWINESKKTTMDRLEILSCPTKTERKSRNSKGTGKEKKAKVKTGLDCVE